MTNHCLSKYSYFKSQKYNSNIPFGVSLSKVTETDFCKSLRNPFAFIEKENYFTNIRVKKDFWLFIWLSLYVGMLVCVSVPPLYSKTVWIEHWLKDLISEVSKLREYHSIYFSSFFGGAQEAMIAN